MSGLIILENKSYDASFTGLNDNTYLWKTLPKQGVLLKNYYGTGHFSLDNYISLVSGQATQPDTQADCPVYDDFKSTVSTRGTVKTNGNKGQAVSKAGPNAPAGTNGCCLPVERLHAVQPVQPGRCELEGLRPGPGKHGRSRGRPVWVHRAPAPRPTRSRTPARPPPTDQLRPEAFPVPL